MRSFSAVLFCILAASELYGFGPVSMVRSGRYSSNAAGLPLKLQADCSDGYCLDVEQDEKGSSERLYQDGEQIAERIITLLDGAYRVKEYRNGQLEREYMLDEQGFVWEQNSGEESRAFRYQVNGEIEVPLPVQQGDNDYLYDDQGRLVAVIGSDSRMMLIDGERKLVEEGDQMSLYTEGKNASRTVWKGEELLIREEDNLLPSGRRELRLRGSLEEILLYDMDDRLKSRRIRSEEGFELYSYTYGEDGKLSSSLYRSTGLREELLYQKEQVLCLRNGEKEWSVEVLEGGRFLLKTYYAGEIIQERRMEQRELAAFAEEYPSFDIDTVVEDET